MDGDASSSTYDSADYLRSAEAIYEYLADVLEGGDLSLILHAFDVIGRATVEPDIERQSGE